MLNYIGLLMFLYVVSEFLISKYQPSHFKGNIGLKNEVNENAKRANKRQEDEESDIEDDLQRNYELMRENTVNAIPVIRDPF